MEKYIEALTLLSNQYGIEVVREELRETFKASLYHTAKYLLNYKDVTKYTHGEIINVLEAKEQQKLIVMPRGSLKSSLGVVAYSIWRLIQNPDLRILIDSELYTNSKNFLREIKAHMESPFYVSLFGNSIGSSWNEGEIILSQRKHPYKEASITCGGVETTKVGQHFDIIIHDDLNSGANSLTPEARQKVINHFQMNTSILEPNGTCIVIATRYAEDDIPGWIIKTQLA